MFNNVGALGVDGPNYGTAGEVLTSCGNGLPPVWAPGGGGSGVFLSDAANNIWSCNTTPIFTGAADNFLVGRNAGACLSNGNGYNNNFIGTYAGYHATEGGYNNFIGTCAGCTENGTYNNYVGKLAGAGPALPKLDYVDVTSATNIPAQDGNYYYLEANTPGGAFIQAWAHREIVTGNVGTLVFDMARSSYAPVVEGETITIPGSDIGGTSPADDAILTLHAGDFGSYSSSNSAFGAYAAAFNYGDVYANIAIGAYAGQYTGVDEFNHIFIGTGAGQWAFGGFYNTFVGAYAGKNAGGSASFSNTFIGTYAGYYAANSFYQTFVGAYSGMSVVNPQGWQGVGNQLFGAFSGECLTTGYGNSFFGAYSGDFTTTGIYNNFFGAGAGSRFTTGSCNTTLGAYSGGGFKLYYAPLSSGSRNTFTGTFSGNYVACESSGNTYSGFRAGAGVSDGKSEFFFAGGTAIAGQENCVYQLSTSQFQNEPTTYSFQWTRPGLVNVCRDGSGSVCCIEVLDPGNSLSVLTFNCIPGALIGGSTPADNLPLTGDTSFSTDANVQCNNTFLGAYAGQASQYGTRNFYGGFRAGAWGCYVQDNVAIGSYAGFCMGGYNNIAIGCCAGALSSGCYNVAIGREAGYSNSTGYNNNFIGNCAGFSNTGGYRNDFIGDHAGYCNTTGAYNVFVGSYAGNWNTTGNGNTGVGSSALYCGGCYNTAVGQMAAGAQTGCYNVAFGGEALKYGSGNYNSAVGLGAMEINCSGTLNVAFGYHALRNLFAGAGNVAIGADAGSYNVSQSVTSCYNTSVGYRALYCGGNAGFSVPYCNNIAIGCCAGTDAVSTITTQSNQIVIGNNEHTNAFIKIGWTVTSDERDKTCVSQISHGREFLQKLEPVQFNWKDRESGEVTDEKPRYGFLAQQVLDAEGEPTILVDDSDPEHLKLRESMMIPVLFKIIQEMDEELRALRAEVNALRG
jgi:hypothetical protein